LLSSKNPTGQINAYNVDSITGALTQVKGSPFSAGGADPDGIAVSPGGKYAYVINKGSNTVAAFSINGDAQLAPLSTATVTTPGSNPIAITINPAGTFLFVVDTYAPGYSATNPGPGAVIVYPLGSDGALGTAVSQTISSTQTAAYYPLGTTPTAINVLPNGNTIYIPDILTAAAAGCNAGQGGLTALTVSSSGALTPVASSPYCAGVAPSSIASTPIGQFLYVTDSSQNQIIGYHINTDGSLLPFVGGPIATGTYPDSITVEPRGLYLYVANRFSQTVQSYSIASGTGIPSSTGTNPTDTFPQCVIVEPALARFVFTADYEGVGSTGFQMNPNTGVLTGTENSPYPGTGLSTCLAAVSHGNHPTTHVQGTA